MMSFVALEDHFWHKWQNKMPNVCKLTKECQTVPKKLSLTQRLWPMDHHKTSRLCLLKSVDGARCKTPTFSQYHKLSCYKIVRCFPWLVYEDTSYMPRHVYLCIYFSISLMQYYFSCCMEETVQTIALSSPYSRRQNAENISFVVGIFPSIAFFNNCVRHHTD